MIKCASSVPDTTKSQSWTKFFEEPHTWRDPKPKHPSSNSLQKKEHNLEKVTIDLMTPCFQPHPNKGVTTMKHLDTAIISLFYAWNTIACLSTLYPLHLKPAATSSAASLAGWCDFLQVGGSEEKRVDESRLSRLRSSMVFRLCFDRYGGTRFVVCLSGLMIV